MNVLIDIGHPAHVHYFKHLATHLLGNGNSVLFTVKDKEVCVQLVQAYEFQYVVLGRNVKGILLKALSLIVYTVKLFYVALKFKPDILINASPSAAFVSWLLRKHHISLEDTFNMEQVRLYLPFTSVVLTGNYEHRSLGKKELRYPGYQELAYLHPELFQPNKVVFSMLNIKEGERYAVVRFVSWNASHDSGHSGMTNENKIKLVQGLSKYIKVFISSEALLPADIVNYVIKIKPEYMHHALFYAHLFIGESATMASESACLGTPTIYVNNSQLGYILDLARYGLICSYTESEDDQDKAIQKALEFAQDTQAKSPTNALRANMLRDKINVNAFLVWFVERYPDSEKEMRMPEFIFDRFR
ncbi:MAG: DUF354 domain-containing protein [Candidatus Cloacimonadaceae bacterium]|nr:DUF354 domain-containing protein [Candidatus Cloacimonadaceae bacterium]